MMRMLPSRQVVASVLVTLVTAAVIGVVLVAITPIGCGPANALGLKSITSRCLKSGPVANRMTPNPTQSYYVTPGATSSPYYPPVSAPQPPYDPGVSSAPVPPYDPSASASSPPYPPFLPPSSDSGTSSAPPLNCRLPVYAGPPGSGGFVVFPGGTYIADPRSGVTLPSPSPGAPSPPPAGPGYGPGYSGLSWDRAYSKWLPVQWANVTPDGGRYAYTSPNSIYVTNVADGTQVELGEGKAWSIVAVQAEGVYATNPNVAGLWLLPYSSPPRQITTSGYWQAEAAGAAYGTMASAVPQGVANTIVRLELNTGAINANYFTRTESVGMVVGFDPSSNPIIYESNVHDGASEVWIATGQNSGRPITGSANGVFVYGPPIADSHGVWFSASINGGGSGQLLYDGSTVYGMTRIGAQLAGGCN